MTRAVGLLLLTLLAAGCGDATPRILEEEPLAAPDSGPTAPHDAQVAVSPDVAPPEDSGATPPPDGKPGDGTCSVAADCVGQIALQPCTKAVCEAGVCELGPSADNIPCDDSDPCYLGKTCSSGTCQGGAAVGCDDGNPCTQDGCAADGSCVYSPAAGGCDDGNPCTLADHCEDGACQAGASVCLCESDAECAQWDDADLCNGSLVCLAGVCQVDPATVVSCPSGAAGACQVLGCDPKTGQCGALTAKDGSACSDGLLCTGGDSCQSGSCQPGPPACPCEDDASCLIYDDGNRCNGVMRCAAGQCVFDPDSVVVCGTTNPCAAGACDPKSGQCEAVPAPDAPCDDQDPCTLGDVCVAGACHGQPKVCDDQNPCTDGGCDEAGSCQFVPNQAPCDDGDDCTEIDVCQNGSCVGTHDICSCLKSADCLAFEDGDPCTGTLSCQQGQCLPEPGSAIVCDPSINTECAKNTCQQGACVLAPINEGAPCFDGDPCTDGETCKGGICGGELAGCDCQPKSFLQCGTYLFWANDAFGSTDVIDTWSCKAGDFSGPEFAWPLFVSQPTEVTIRLDDEEVTTDLFVIEDTGGGCSPKSCTQAAVSKLSFLASPDKTYYVVVDGKKGAAGKFTITVDCDGGFETQCQDQKDNDTDGATDCADSDCQGDLACQGGEDCANLVDDDGDLKVDCDDSDCAADPICLSTCVPETNAYCWQSQPWQTSGGANQVSSYGTCGVQSFDGPDFFYTFNAAKSETVTVDLQPSFPGASVFVIQDQGGGCFGANCIASGPGSASFNATAGVKYYFGIDGANGAAGGYTIKVDCK